MKNSFKKVSAALLAVFMLFSAASCSKVSKGDIEENNDKNITDSIETNPQAEAIRNEIEQKAAEIIATLEEGKTYDEIPITAKKLGVERFSSIMYSEGSASQPQQFYVDLTEGQVCVMPEYFNQYLPIWFLGENDSIEKIYYQLDKTVVPYDDISEVDYENLSEFYSETGYDIYTFSDNVDELDFTYVGTEEVEGYGETLVFEAVLGCKYNKYNIDPETGFWVKYYYNSNIEALYDVMDYEFLIKQVVIEPNFNVPDFENVVDNLEHNGFSTMEEVAEEWLTAVENMDLDALSSMIPQSEEVHNEFYGSYDGATPKHWCSIIAGEMVSMLHFNSEEYYGLTDDEIELELYEEQVLTGNLDENSDIEEAVYRIYTVSDTEEDVGISVVFVKEKGNGWFALVTDEGF